MSTIRTIGIWVVLVVGSLLAGSIIAVGCMYMVGTL